MLKRSRSNRNNRRRPAITKAASRLKRYLSSRTTVPAHAGGDEKDEILRIAISDTDLQELSLEITLAIALHGAENVYAEKVCSSTENIIDSMVKALAEVPHKSQLELCTCPSDDVVGYRCALWIINAFLSNCGEALIRNVLSSELISSENRRRALQLSAIICLSSGQGYHCKFRAFRKRHAYVRQQVDSYTMMISFCKVMKQIPWRMLFEIMVGNFNSESVKLLAQSLQYDWMCFVVFRLLHDRVEEVSLEEQLFVYNNFVLLFASDSHNIMRFAENDDWLQLILLILKFNNKLEKQMADEYLLMDEKQHISDEIEYQVLCSKVCLVSQMMMGTIRYLHTEPALEYINIVLAELSNQEDMIRLILYATANQLKNASLIRIWEDEFLTHPEWHNIVKLLEIIEDFLLFDPARKSLKIYKSLEISDFVLAKATAEFLETHIRKNGCQYGTLNKQKALSSGPLI